MNKDIVDKISQIYSSIKNAIGSNKIEQEGLFDGLAGAVLFLFYYEQYIHKNQTIATNTLLKLVNKESDSYFFASGIAGIGWMINHIKNKKFINVDLDDIFTDINIYMFKALQYHINKNEYDFLYGYLGIVFYFLQQPEIKMRNEAITQVIPCLKTSAIKEKNKNGRIMYKWISEILDENSQWEKVYNLSLSHGISSIIRCLSLYFQYESFSKDCLVIISRAVEYILSQEMDPAKYGSFFQNIENKNNEYSRLAWCYGDLGIANALYYAGQTLNRQKWINKAIEIFLFSAKNRRNLQKNMVVDAGLCHGTAGIGHIFYRMYWNTRYPEFKEAADYWFKETLKMAKFEDGLAGYKSFQGKDGWVNSYGLLEGISGIGLALLSYTYNLEPTWDECLLLS